MDNIITQMGDKDDRLIKWHKWTETIFLELGQGYHIIIIIISVSLLKAEGLLTDPFHSRSSSRDRPHQYRNVGKKILSTFL